MAFMVPVTLPFTSPCTMPLTRTRPLAVLARSTEWCMEKDVLSTSTPPSSRICGRTNNTRMMEMMVPRPRHWPMPTMQASEVI